MVKLVTTARASQRIEGQNASCVLKHDRILNECNSILIKAFRFEEFEICLLKRILDLNVIAARLEEFRKYDRTSNWACVWQVLASTQLSPPSSLRKATTSK